MILLLVLLKCFCVCASSMDIGGDLLPLPSLLMLLLLLPMLL